MIRVLYSMPSFEHGHSYLGDLLLVGFCELAEQSLIELEIRPRARHVSLPEDPDRPGSWYPAPGSRDHCQLDCDSALPDLPGMTGEPDLIIGHVHCLEDLKKIGGRAPVIIIDGFDNSSNFRAQANEAAGGRMCAYFKRELPLGQSWAIPLPFTYPERWIPGPWHANRSGVTYYTSIHAGNAASRICIAEGLRELCGDLADVITDDNRQRRPTPELLHARLWYSSVGVHWNKLTATSDHGWDSHRAWENWAHGVAVVGQRPFIEMPDPFVDGEHVIWCDDPGQVPVEVKRLLDEPERALKIALAGHLHFLQYHGATSRARYVLKHCGFDLDKKDVA